jgi:hypothetical protein
LWFAIDIDGTVVQAVVGAVVVLVEEVELPPSEPSLRLGGLGESAVANS